MQEADRLDEEILVPCEAFFSFWLGWRGQRNRMNREVQQKNVADSLKALEGAKKLGCRTFLFSGSQAEYGIHQDAMTEETTFKSVSEYGKAEGDFFCRKAMELTAGFRYIHARIFSVYGPGTIRGHWWKAV